MAPTTAFVSIDYDEADPASYRGVEVTFDRKRIAYWGTGNPQADWASFRAWQDERSFGLLVGTLSSVTHFLHDVPGWRMIEDARGREILVPEDRPGFEDVNGVLIPPAAAPNM